MLAVDGLRASYGTSEILFGVSLQVRPGEVVVAYGPQWHGQVDHAAQHHGHRAAAGGLDRVQ